MMMKKTIFSLFILLFAFTFCTAQMSKKNERKFLAELNSILKNSKEQHWAYKGKMKVESPFTIKNDTISSIVSYKTDSTFLKIKMEAPFKKIVAVDYDLYIILRFAEEEVFVTEINEKGEKYEFKNNLFHIITSI